MRGRRRDPSLIARSRTEASESGESVSLSDEEKRRAARDAIVAQAEDTAAISVVARVVGTGDEARQTYLFVLVAVMILPMAFVFLTTKNEATRSDILGLFEKSILLGVGFFAGQMTARRR